MRNAEFGRSCMTFPATSHESQELAFSPELRNIRVSQSSSQLSRLDELHQAAVPESQAVSFIIMTTRPCHAAPPHCKKSAASPMSLRRHCPLRLEGAHTITVPAVPGACCPRPARCRRPPFPPWAASRVGCPASSIPRVKIAAVDTELSVLVQAGAMVCNFAHLLFARLFSISRLCCCPVFQVRAHRARGKRRWTHGTAMGCWIMDDGSWPAVDDRPFTSDSRSPSATVRNTKLQR